jgi:hypothetical protein
MVPVAHWYQDSSSNLKTFMNEWPIYQQNMLPFVPAELFQQYEFTLLHLAYNINRW